MKCTFGVSWKYINPLTSAIDLNRMKCTPNKSKAAFRAAKASADKNISEEYKISYTLHKLEQTTTVLTLQSSVRSPYISRTNASTKGIRCLVFAAFTSGP